MKAFKDDAGRTWNLAITAGSAKRVRGLLNGVDILQPQSGNPPLYLAVHRDVILLVDIIFCLVKPEADAQSISDEAFGEAMNGEAVELTYRAFMAELSDFFRGRQRPDLAMLLDKQAELVAEQVQQQTKIVVAAVTIIRKKMAEKSAVPGLGTTSTNSRGSSGRTRTRTRSPNC